MDIKQVNIKDVMKKGTFSASDIIADDSIGKLIKTQGEEPVLTSERKYNDVMRVVTPHKGRSVEDTLGALAYAMNILTRCKYREEFLEQELAKKNRFIENLTHLVKCRDVEIDYLKSKTKPEVDEEYARVEIKLLKAIKELVSDY